MAAARQDQNDINEILVQIDKDGLACAEWNIQDAEPVYIKIPDGHGLDATEILQHVLTHDPGTTQAALKMDPEALMKFSWSSARPDDYRQLSADRLGRAPGCFISMDNAMDFHERGGGISKFTFWLQGQVVTALASVADLQKTEHPSTKPRTPGRI